MVSLLKHFSWMFAKVFISGKLFAKVLILCKILKQGFLQGIILLFSFIFLLMPPINHELLQRCQRAGCLSDCKWQAMNNAHRSHREAPKATACCLWALVRQSTSVEPGFCLVSGELCTGQSLGIPGHGPQLGVHDSWGQANHWGIWSTKRELQLPKEQN